MNFGIFLLWYTNVGGFWLTQGPYPTPPTRPNQIKKKEKEKKGVEKTEN
jgi:hypothetical protein